MGRTCIMNINDYKSTGKNLLNKVNVPTKHAEILMLSLLDADTKGIYTHGIYRLSTYLKQIKRGNINPKPNIKKVEQGNVIRVVDGNNGLGSVISHYSMENAIETSRTSGIGVVSVRGSNHFGTAAYYAEMAAKKDQIGIVMTNASPALAPTGGKEAVLGNNPWSISVNTNLGYPITLDMANSVARGKIRLKALEEESIPLGWALDNEGNPTTDAKKALEGVILPIADHKGYGITLMVDLLTGVLSGANFGDKIPLIDQDGQRNNGHLFISLDIKRFMEVEVYKSKVDELIDTIKAVPKIDKSKEILLPGEKEWRYKLNQKENKVQIPENIVNIVEELCNYYKVPFPKSKIM